MGLNFFYSAKFAFDNFYGKLPVKLQIAPLKFGKMPKGFNVMSDNNFFLLDNILRKVEPNEKNKLYLRFVQAYKSVSNQGTFPLIDFQEVSFKENLLAAYQKELSQNLFYRWANCDSQIEVKDVFLAQREQQRYVFRFPEWNSINRVIDLPAYPVTGKNGFIYDFYFVLDQKTLDNITDGLQNWINKHAESSFN